MDVLTCIFAILKFFSIANSALAGHYAHDFFHLVNKPHFVDKSEFIKDILSTESNKILISCPRGFGKTINLQMLQSFLEMEPDDYGVPKHPSNATACKIFENLTISKYPKIIEGYMAKHPVLFLDLEADPVLESFERADIIRQVNSKLYNCFAKHNWLLQIPQDVLVNHYGIDANNIDFMRRLYEKNLGNEDEKDDNVLHTMLYDLATILRKYYRSSVVILVDNYDSMVINSFKPSGRGIIAYYDYLNGILQRALEIADLDTVAGGVVMGTSGLVLANIRTFLSKTEFHPFMGEESKFIKHFGLVEQEVIELLDRYDNRDHLNDIKSYYNGYKTIYQDIAIYNPSSVNQYLENLHNNPLKVYWSHSLIDNFLLSFFNDTLIRNVVNTIISNDTTGYHMAESYTAANFRLFFDFSETYHYEKTDQGLVLWFLYDHGYLSHRIVETETPGQFIDAMGAPNQETRRALENLLERSNQFVREHSSEMLVL